MFWIIRISYNYTQHYALIKLFFFSLSLRGSLPQAVQVEDPTDARFNEIKVPRRTAFLPLYSKYTLLIPTAVNTGILASQHARITKIPNFHPACPACLVKYLPHEILLLQSSSAGFHWACPVKQIRRISCFAGFHWACPVKQPGGLLVADKGFTGDIRSPTHKLQVAQNMVKVIPGPDIQITGIRMTA